MNRFIDMKIESSLRIEDELIQALESVLESWELGHTPKEDESVYQKAQRIVYKAKHKQYRGM